MSFPKSFPILRDCPVVVRQLWLFSMHTTIPFLYYSSLHFSIFYAQSHAFSSTYLSAIRNFAFSPYCFNAIICYNVKFFSFLCMYGAFLFKCIFSNKVRMFQSNCFYICTRNCFFFSHTLFWKDVLKDIF